MNELRIREGGPPVECDLDGFVVERLTAAGVVVAAPLGSGRWELRAARKVGVVRIGALTVWVKPKVTIARLLWLLGWAKRAVFEAPGPVDLEETDDLVPALAEAFCLQAERALQMGLLQGYREIEGSETVLRGRLRTGDQLRRRYGIPIPLLVRYDDYLVDITENQILKAAASKLLALPGVSASVRSRLRNLRGLLVEVSDVVPGVVPLGWHATRLNARYHDALWLGEIVLAGGSVEQEPGRTRIDGFLIDLYQVFENFVVATLGTALEQVGGRCQSQDPFTLDEDESIDIRPDLVWRLGGRAVAVIDAKYKAEKPNGFPQADLYQALAYATAYGIPVVHLVYAKGNELAQAWTVRHARVRIIAHTLDLNQPPAEIVNRVVALAGMISASKAIVMQELPNDDGQRYASDSMQTAI